MSWVRDHRMLVGLVVGVPVSAVFLWLAARNADASAVRDALEDASPAPVAVAVVAMLAVYAFQALRWRSVANTHAVTHVHFYTLVVSGVACNNVVPGRLGDLFRARWLGLDARIPAGRALGTVVLDRGFDLVALFAFLSVGLFAVANDDWLIRIALGTFLGLVGLAAVLVFARQYTTRRSRERRGRGLVRRVLRDAAELLAEPLGRTRPLIWFALSIVAWGTWALAAILIARSLDIELSLLEAMFVAAVMNLGVAIPSSPGFVGTYQWLGVASLGLLGVGDDEALAFAILLHASWYIPTTIIGGIAIVVRTVRSRRPRASRETTANEGA
jgi:glycosyltransferase 2 family protein